MSLIDARPSSSASTVCFGLEIEGHQMPPALKKSTKVQKDHFLENVRRVKQIQKQRVNKENETKQPVKALWKSTKYENVESKVKEDLDKALLAPRPESVNFLRAHSRTNCIPLSARPSSAGPANTDLQLRRSSTARDPQPGRSSREIDFIKANGCAARQYRIARSPSLSALENTKKQKEEALASHRKGQLPQYLLNRKEEWQREEEEERLRRPDPDMPPGHRLLPDAERVETLQQIKNKHADLSQQLIMLPIRTDTLRVRKLREQIEQQLIKIEEAMQIFSRKKVFVRLDS